MDAPEYIGPIDMAALSAWLEEIAKEEGPHRYVRMRIGKNKKRTKCRVWTYAPLTLHAGRGPKIAMECAGRLAMERDAQDQYAWVEVMTNGQSNPSWIWPDPSKREPPILLEGDPELREAGDDDDDEDDEKLSPKERKLKRAMEQGNTAAMVGHVVLGLQGMAATATDTIRAVSQSFQVQIEGFRVQVEDQRSQITMLQQNLIDERNKHLDTMKDLWKEQHSKDDNPQLTAFAGSFGDRMGENLGERLGEKIEDLLDGWAAGQAAGGPAPAPTEGEPSEPLPRMEYHASLLFKVMMEHPEAMTADFYGKLKFAWSEVTKGAKQAGWEK